MRFLKEDKSRVLGTKTSYLHSAWSMTSDLSELRVWMGLKTHCVISPWGQEDGRTRLLGTMLK